MREQATMRGITTLVFSGGVIHNRLLRARLAHYLADFTLLFPQSLPAGDGGLSLGQGVIAAARWLAGLHMRPRRSDKTRQRRIRHFRHSSPPTSAMFSTIQMPLSSDPH